MFEFGGFNVYFNASPSKAMFTFISITFLCITVGINAIDDNGEDCTDFLKDLLKSDKQQPENPLNFEEKFKKSQQNPWHSANSSKKAKCLVKSEPSEDPQQFWGGNDKMNNSIKKEVLLDEVKVEKVENFDDWSWHDGTIRAETVKVEQQNVSVGSEEEQQKGSDEHTSAGLMEESSAERKANTCAFKGKKKIYSQNEKRRLIEKFEKLRTAFLAKSPRTHQLRLDDLIKQKLGISWRAINYWKSELGLTSQIRRSQTERNKIVKLFEELRDQNPHIGNKKLVKMLKTSDRSLARWKKELNAEKTYSITDKQKMIKKFGNLKKNYMAKPQKTKKPMQEIEKEIARELGVTRGRIYAWKKKLGLSKKSFYKEAEKIEVVKQYFEIQRENPKMSITEIAKALGVGLTSIRTWKKQFATFVNGGCAPSSAAAGAADALLLQKSSGLLPPFPNANNNKWKWNSSTKRRTPKRAKLF